MPAQRIPLIWEYDPAIFAPAKYRRACRYEAYVPEALCEMALSLEAEVAGIAAEADAAIRGLNSVAQPALAPLARLLLRTESVASSKVEGMQLGARELARAEARMETGEKVGPAAQEVIRNIDAMTLALEEATRAERFGLGEIRAIHRQLMADAPNSARIAGNFRTTQNWIGGNDHNPCGADYVPPPPEYLPTLLSDLCHAINEEVLPPIVQAALVHAQFETIHPFDDGNGRTGRALIHVVLRRRGVARDYVPPISAVLALAKDRYIQGLTRSREGRIGDWIEHFAGAAASAAHLATSYLTEVQALSKRWRAMLAASPSPPRADAAAWAIIDILPAHPLITGPVAAAAIGRSKPSVYQALQELETAGVLVALSAGKRNRSWEAMGLLDLLAGLEDGQLLP